MALRSVVQCLQRLSLQTWSQGSQLPASTSSLVPGLRGFQTSSICCRVLDRKSYPPSMVPTPRKGRWIEIAPIREQYEYRIKPVPFPKTGGRGPNGRIWNYRRAGGHKRNYRMIDWSRGGPTEGKALEERVQSICYDPNRSARIALVVGGDRKRYIIATQNMAPGQVIRSSQQLTETTVKPSEGDAHPLGSLALGTILNSVAMYPGHGSMFARAAGVQAQLIRKSKEWCTIRLPSKREANLSPRCMATVGRVSNIDHNKRVIGKAGRNRWLGIRPKSGRFKKKTGRFGRKIRPIKATKTYVQPRKKTSPMKLLPARLLPKNVKIYHPKH